MALRAAREKATFRAMPESLSSEENRRADEASGDAAETCFSQFALRLGFFGFALSLLALVFFWIPGAGLALWIFGLALSLFGLARAPRGFGFSGVFVSGVALVFMFVFSGGGEELSERRAAVADASAASAAPRGGKSAAGTADFSAAESGAEAPSDGVPAAEDFSPAEPSASAGTGSAPASGASVAVGGAAASAGTAARLNEGREPFFIVPKSVNWLTTSAFPPTSRTERFIFPAPSSKMRARASREASQATSRSESPVSAPSSTSIPAPISPTTFPSISTEARLTR